MKKKLRIALVVLAAAGGLYGFNLLATRGNGKELVYSGTVEATTVTPSFQVGGRITSLALEEGTTVRKDQVIGTLEDAEPAGVVRQAEAALAAAKARQAAALARADFALMASQAKVASAQAALDRARAGLRPQEVERARQAVEEAKARAATAQDEAKRAEDLFAGGAVSQARRDAALRAAEAARAARKGAEEALAMAEEGTRKEDLAAAEAGLAAAEAEGKQAAGARLEAEAALRSVAQAEAELALARTRLSRSTLLSPIDGVVLTRAAEVGELAVPGVPVASLADLSSVSVRFYIPEGEVGGVKLGMSASVTTDSTGGRVFAGKVAYISDRAEFTPKTIETREERVKLVYRAKVEVPNPDGALKPGMPADVDLTGEKGR